MLLHLALEVVSRPSAFLAEGMGVMACNGVYFILLLK